MERISLPKAHRTHRRDLPIPQYHPFLKCGAQCENIPKVIPRFTVWPSAYLATKGVGNRRNNKFEDPYRWWGTTVSYILARVEYMGHTVNFKTCYRDKHRKQAPKEDWKIFENTYEAINEYPLSTTSMLSEPHFGHLMSMFSMGHPQCGQTVALFEIVRPHSQQRKSAIIIIPSFSKFITLCHVI